MAIQRLGLANPAANTDTSVYTSNASYLVSVLATNKGNTSHNIRVWVVPSGATQVSQYGYIVYDVPVPVGNSIETHRFAIQLGDIVRVRSNSSDTSFSVNGIYDSTATFDAHIAQTTNVHGIANTANLVTNTQLNALDSRIVSIELGLGIFD